MSLAFLKVIERGFMQKFAARSYSVKITQFPWLSLISGHWLTTFPEVRVA